MKPISKANDEEFWGFKIYEEGPDPEFTSNVMKALENIEMDPRGLDGGLQKKVSFKQAFRRMVMTGAAAVILMGGAYMVWQNSPDSASLIGEHRYQGSDSLSTNGDWLWDEEYERAQRFDLLLKQDVKVEDDGYSMEIMAVLKDRSHIVIMTKQFGPDGRSLKDSVRDPFLITDTQGRQVAIPGRHLRNTDSGIQDYVYVFNGTVPDHIVIHGKAVEVVADPEQQPQERVLVNWPLELTMDMTNAKSLSVSKPLEDTYSTQDGLNMDMKQLLITPNGVRMDMSISLAPQMLEQVPSNWHNGLEVLYHVKIKEGNGYKTIGSYVKKVETQQMNTSSGTLEWSNEFDSTVIPPDSGQLRVVVDGLIMRFINEGAIQLNPRELDKNPAVMTDGGDTLTFTKSSLLKDTSTGEQAVALYAKGRFVNQPLLDEWIAVDNNGQEYKVHIGGAYTKGDPITSEYLEFAIQGLTNIPPSITLKRTVIGKKRDFQWAFDLPVVSNLPW
ncbi:hypothetical protein [Paenibacillus sp. ISL-20]|uniref:hypothetical protein n=1 Tax=Paenibacillus sp. ISL-20 TaxID=2819163 RepID=UPI001BE82DAF|nr:hypothetical protein [Paenibacillus sp. ISL-20]MBT2763450.1 hypothetical protein [Paenibacillus sp. ISL-20]